MFIADHPDQLRLDRIKTGLTVAAGLAAGVALLMTLRRQVLSARARRFAETDAPEQRATALYIAAAEQLGSDKAAVRLAGLYALERLGQDNPKLRQIVVDVWCAYLRMPYTPPIEVLRRNTKRPPARPVADDESPDPAGQAERRQELQVRLTAQRLLATHLRSVSAEADESTYWLDAHNARMELDLAGAVLVDFTLGYCAVGRVNFSRAEFHGDAWLNEAHFDDNANFSGAHFHGHADFGGAQFDGGANFSRAHFHRDAALMEAKFYCRAGFSGAQFHGDAYLGEAQFHLAADLSRTQFHGDAHLGGAQFHEDADLSEAKFHRDAILGGVQFYGMASVRETEFHGGVLLPDALFTGSADLSSMLVTSETWVPDGWALSSVRTDAGELRTVVRVTSRRVV